MIDYRIRAAVKDADLSGLHRIAFAAEAAVISVDPWAERLERHSLSWVSAYAALDLVGFVNVAWDGGRHAFLLDTVVHPEHQHQGIGAELVRRAADEARVAGCEWLHVDFEPHLEAFYLDSCGFRPTAAGLLRLSPMTALPITNREPR